MPTRDHQGDPRDAELERLTRLKDDFLVTLSHELRTPMTVVLGWARTLLAGGLEAPYAREAVEAIERNARHQLSLINSVLDVSDIVQGRLRLTIDAVNLLSLVSDVVESVRPAAFSRQIDIAWAPVSERIVVAGDAARLRQVAWHLLSNAVRFTGVGGRVAVRVTHDQGEAVLQVSDNGIGISKEFLPHVFEPFRQADATSRREHGGLGLGLAIVRHVVELHGGRVTAASRGPGQGASFSVMLPLRAAVAGEAGGVEAPASGGEEGRRRLDGRTVMVVAGAEEGDLVEAILAGAGAAVRRAASAAEAAHPLGMAPLPDVLVVDVGLEGDGGYDVIRRIRTRPADQGGHVPAVALIRGAAVREMDRALEAGFQVHVAKPVLPGQLVEAVATLAGREVWS